MDGKQHTVVWLLVGLALIGLLGWALVTRRVDAPPPPVSPGEAAMRAAVQELQRGPGAEALGPDEPSRQLAARVRAVWPDALRRASESQAGLGPFASTAPACWARVSARGAVVLLAPAELSGAPLPDREALLFETWTIARAAAAQGGLPADSTLGVGLRSQAAFSAVALGQVGDANPDELKVALAVLPARLYPLLEPADAAVAAVVTQ